MKGGDQKWDWVAEARTKVSRGLWTHKKLYWIWPWQYPTKDKKVHWLLLYCVCVCVCLIKEGGFLYRWWKTEKWHLKANSVSHYSSALFIMLLNRLELVPLDWWSQSNIPPRASQMMNEARFRSMIDFISGERSYQHSLWSSVDRNGLSLTDVCWANQEGRKTLPSSVDTLNNRSR